MQNRLKLLYMVEAMGGGVFTYIVDLANELVNSYDVYIAYAVRPQTPTDYNTYFDKRIHLIKVENFMRSVNFIKDSKAFFEIRKIERKVQPNFIHLHSSKAGVLGRLAFNGDKVPVFYTPHGYSFLMVNHGFFKRSIYKLTEMLFAKRLCTTISCSEGEHEETLKFTQNAKYINNGINTKQLQSILETVEVKRSQTFTVFTLGRICHQKNPALFNQIAEAMPNIRFMWIGDGELRNLLVSPNIEITGWIERKEALRRSMSADVFILTSLWEGLPISLLEAMYMQKICIVSNVIGNCNVIHNLQNGFLCNSLEEFVFAIKASNSNENRDMVARAYKEIKEKYNTVVMAEKYNDIYRKAIEGVERK